MRKIGCKNVSFLAIQGQKKELSALPIFFEERLFMKFS